MSLIDSEFANFLKSSFADAEEVSFISLAYKEFLPLHYIEGGYS